MTSEEYFRAVLLGGMQPTSLLSMPRGSGMITVGPESSGSLSSPELEKLQQSTLGQLPQAESVHVIWRQNRNVRNFYATLGRGHHAIRQDRGTPGNVFESIVSDALTRASQGAQWDSLRADILSRLESVYVFRDEARVRSFLAKNAFLAPLLLQASSKIVEYFGASFPVALDVSLDPDNGESQELWARIQTQLAPEDALPILTRFDEEWWLRASETSGNLLNIKMEYV